MWVWSKGFDILGSRCRGYLKGSEGKEGRKLLKGLHRWPKAAAASRVASPPQFL